MGKETAICPLKAWWWKRVSVGPKDLARRDVEKYCTPRSESEMYPKSGKTW